MGLLAAVLLAAVVVAPLIGPDAAGFATTAALPTPPTPGSCLVSSPDGLREVPCGDPHTAEVTAAWPAWDPSVAGVDVSVVRSHCWTLGQRYLAEFGLNRETPTDAPQPQGPDWSPVPLTIRTDLLWGPTRRTDPIGWQACVVVPQAAGGPNTAVGQYDGRIVELISMSRRAPALRSCYSGRGSVLPTVPCVRPHRGEVLAAATAPLTAAAPKGGTPGDPSRLAQCRTLAAKLIGVADPTFGGRLRVTVNSKVVSLGLTERGGQLVSQQSVALQCAVEAPGSRALTSSVIGLAGAPLPLA